VQGCLRRMMVRVAHVRAHVRKIHVGLVVRRISRR
jgi:hypothetical protein